MVQALLLRWTTKNGTAPKINQFLLDVPGQGTNDSSPLPALFVFCPASTPVQPTAREIIRKGIAAGCTIHPAALGDYLRPETKSLRRSSRNPTDRYNTVSPPTTATSPNRLISTPVGTCRVSRVKFVLSKRASGCLLSAAARAFRDFLALVCCLMMRVLEELIKPR